MIMKKFEAYSDIEVGDEIMSVMGMVKISDIYYSEVSQELRFNAEPLIPEKNTLFPSIYTFVFEDFII